VGRNEASYSLVEILAVLACTAVLLAAAAPSFHQVRHEWALWGAAHMLEASLQWGRFRAIAENTSLALQIEGEGRRYCWVDGASGDAYLESRRHLPSGLRISASPGRLLRFFPRGNAAPAGTYVIEGEAGRYRVIVNIAGRIRVERP
jgi:hypothetical protein